MAISDTVWLYPYPTLTSKPAYSTTFPGRLGICPTLQISAMVLDWAGENHHDSIDVDFGGIYNGNDYTMVTYLDSTGEIATNNKCGGHVLGMVLDSLVNGNPARVDSSVFPWSMCSAAREIEKWFVPETLATDASGKKYRNAVCRDIDLTLDEEGFWLADITEAGDCNDPDNPGFYPIDNFKYLDSAMTLYNPKYDSVVQGCRHNYSFSMKISAQFQYVKGQYFEFRGDDDVWVFINNRLVVDIGGCHSPVEGSVNLDTLGLVEGNEYPFHIFFSERNATGSNFKMRTSINLQTEKTYYAFTDAERDRIIKDKDPSKLKIQRSKGLGENDAETMAKFINPETRHLVQVTAEDAKTMEYYYDLFMGTQVEPRRQYIEENGHLYMDDLDLS